MTTGVSVPNPAPATALPDPWRPKDRVLAWVLMVAWLALAACTVALGHREASYDDLRAALDAGEVSSVEVVGSWSEEFGPDWSGDVDPFGGSSTSTVSVRWRSGLLAYETEVVEVRPARAARRARREGFGVVVEGSVSELLSERHPDVRVTTAARRSGANVEMWGWRLDDPPWVGLAALGVVLATVVFLASSPQPWRATRWAWAWIVLLLPLGAIAYLVVGGPTGWLRPRERSRVLLTGGWAFLIVTGIGVLLGL